MGFEQGNWMKLGGRLGEPVEFLFFDNYFVLILFWEFADV